MTSKQHIMIKGVKDGLLFLLDDQCDFDIILTELKHKIEKTHQQLLSGPLIHITIKLGSRTITEDQSKQMSEIIRSQGNLIIQAIESEQPDDQAKKAHGELKILSSIIRSGQEIVYDGDLLLLGDVHPGGVIRCTGDIYIFGSMKGQAHAGSAGRENAIIVASYLQPTQLKINETLSKPLEEWTESDGLMEYAYIADGQMHIQKITMLHRENKLPILMRGV